MGLKFLTQNLTKCMFCDPWHYTKKDLESIGIKIYSFSRFSQLNCLMFFAQKNKLKQDFRSFYWFAVFIYMNAKNLLYFLKWLNNNFSLAVTCNKKDKLERIIFW